jgi:hypothetical protein
MGRMMAGRSSAAMIQAMRYIIEASMTPYAAAKRAQIDLRTMYRSRLYKLWRAGHGDELAKEMDQVAPKPRRPKKGSKYGA